MLKETSEGRHKRHEEMAKWTQGWAKKHFEMFPEPGYESITVSTIKNTQGKSVADLNKELAKRDYMISNGYGDLKEKTFTHVTNSECLFFQITITIGNHIVSLS